MRRVMTTIGAMTVGALFLTGAAWAQDNNPGARSAVPSAVGKMGNLPAATRARVPGPATVIKMKRVTVPQPAPTLNSNQVVRDAPRVEMPRRNWTGKKVTAPAATTPPANHQQVAHNPGVTQGIQYHESRENKPHHDYWHHQGGVRYVHHYDGHHHWYGFYHGPHFYWSRHYDGRWWWWDPMFYRWVFWWNGYWWWPGPGNVVYVYVNNTYYPYERGGVVVVREPEVALPAQDVNLSDAQQTVVSPDDRRLVQVSGTRADAFLYDNTVRPAAFLKYLGQGVERVRFSGGKAGSPLLVMLEFADKRFALFDAEGNPQDAVAVSGATDADAPGDVPTSIPPIPTAAPGQ